MDESESYLYPKTSEKPKPMVPHYYGDIVRKLFVAGAIAMFIYIPFETAQMLLPVSLLTMVLLALSVTFLAGYTNPRERWTMLFDTVTSAILGLIFEYFAIIYYTNTHVFDFVFFARQVLAVIFLIALYFSSKSLRGMSV